MKLCELDIFKKGDTKSDAINEMCLAFERPL